MQKRLAPKEVLQLYQEKGLPESFCPVPFSTLIFEADGRACTCRLKGTDAPVGDLRQQSFREIWNGEKMQAIRKEFLAGQPVFCAREVAQDRCHLSANNADLLPHIELSPIQTRPPIRISPNFNGKCNLECKMCHIWQWPNGLYDDFWPTLEHEILPHLVEIDTFSGEPFLQKDTFRLIELASRVNPNIVWSFTTNANWRFNDKIRSFLDRVKIKTFDVSIDSLDEETYGEIRRKGNLKMALATFADLRAYEQDRISRGLSAMGFVIHVVVQKDNWREIPAFLRFRRETGVKINLNFLRLPAALSLSALPAAKKIEILQFYLDTIEPTELKMIARLYRSLLDGLDRIDRASLITQYRNRVVL